MAGDLRKNSRRHWATPVLTMIPFFALFFLLFSFASESHAFDWDFEGRAKVGSSYVFDSPPFHEDFDSEAELRLGVLGNFWQGEEWLLDYELSGDIKFADGPSEQSGLRDDFEADFFRAWLRFGNDRTQLRGGRQKIVFGAGTIFRPLGFFDTRDVTGVVPETRGVDSVRLTHFFDETTMLEGWAVPGRLDDHVIAGMRWEGQIFDLDTGFVVQYHPKTDLDDLPSFDQDLIQLGYHFKGEYEIGFWNESRLDIERIPGEHALRLDTVVGADYTFDLGQGLHVLVEYFLIARQREFTPIDLSDDRLIEEIGVLFDQPVGIDIVWQVFGLFDIRDGSFQVVPQIEWNFWDSAYLYIHGRWGDNLTGNRQTGRLFRKLPLFTGTESIGGLTLVAYF